VEMPIQTTVAIFKDHSDAGLWEAYLDGISTLYRLTADGLAHRLGRLAARGVTPRLVIISSRLYPVARPELAAEIRAVFPEAELLLISSTAEPTPPLLPLAADNVRHLAVNPPEVKPADKGYFDWVLGKLTAGRPLAIADRLKERTGVITLELAGSEEKEALLRALDAEIAGLGEDGDVFRQRAALLADELIENAMYGAPRNQRGEALFRKGEPRRTMPGERLAFSFGFDGETLAMEMTDSWGTLEPDLVVEHLARNQGDLYGTCQLGGRGLFLIWRFFDHFHVCIHPGTRTVVGGDLQLSGKLDPEAPRGFHITSLVPSEG